MQIVKSLKVPWNQPSHIARSLPFSRTAFGGTRYPADDLDVAERDYEQRKEKGSDEVEEDAGLDAPHSVEAASRRSHHLVQAVTEILFIRFRAGRNDRPF